MDIQSFNSDFNNGNSRNNIHKSAPQPYDDWLKQPAFQFDNDSMNPQKQIPSAPPVPIPPPLPNGGLYGGPQSTMPWANIPVIPEMHVYITQNLRSANPPPGATSQMVGTNRLGNNSITQTNVRWYQPDPNNPYLKKQPSHSIYVSDPN